MRTLIGRSLLGLALVWVGSGAAWGTILLQDDFSGSTLNASKWNVIKRPSSEVLLTESGELEVRMTQGIYVQEGVVSVQSFPVLAGERLVVDFYGTNSSGWTTGYDSQVCRPYWMVCPVNRSGSESIDAQYMSHARIIGGAEYAVGDRINYKNSGLPNGYNVGSLTYGAYKHCIITVDRANVNFYISDTAYDRSMTPLYTVATSSVFTSTQLDSGLFVYLLNERYVDGVMTNYERFDGVQVSRVTGASMQGTVRLDQYVGDNVTVGVKFTFQPVGGGTGFTRIASLDSAGAFSLDNITPGTYDVLVKAPAWVGVKLSEVTFELGVPKVIADPIVLTGADCNGDDAVSFEDFAILQNSYGESGASSADALSAAAAAGGCGPAGIVILSLLGFAAGAFGWRVRE